MFTYLNEFLHRYNYPTKSKDELMDTYQQLQQTAKYSLFQDYVKAYQQDAVSSFKEIINGLQKIAEEENLKEYSLNLLYLILISKHLNEIYEDLQWSEEMYDEAMFDLKYSMIECYRVYRIWGNFKMEWELRFFALKRVALGRLQFELQEFSTFYNHKDNRLNSGDKVVSVYIPSSGPLRICDCEKSFSMASKFFRKDFKDKKIPFVLSSWLLNPMHRCVLSEDSNIVQFMNIFDIYEVEEEQPEEVLWRIFGHDWKAKPKALPRGTTLQKAYAEWLLKGTQMKKGTGVFFYTGDV